MRTLHRVYMRLLAGWLVLEATFGRLSEGSGLVHSYLAVRCGMGAIIREMQRLTT